VPRRDIPGVSVRGEIDDCYSGGVSRIVGDRDAPLLPTESGLWTSARFGRVVDRNRRLGPVFRRRRFCSLLYSAPYVLVGGVSCRNRRSISSSTAARTSRRGWWSSRGESNAMSVNTSRAAVVSRTRTVPDSAILDLSTLPHRRWSPVFRTPS
jgi:hypothetical protein